MLPEFKIFEISFATYGFFTAIGIILMTAVALKLSEKTKVSYLNIVLGEIVALAGGFLGAHLLYAIVNFSDYLPYYKFIFNGNFDLKTLFETLYHHFYGMVFYGGLIFALISGVIFCKIRKISLEDFSDCFAVAIPLFHCFGRIGCFLSGCCYGIESKFGFTATQSLISSCNGVNRFPVQLLEAFLNLMLFTILSVLFYKGIIGNKLIFLYLNIYSVIRFCDEFLRGDTYRGIWLYLSTSQWISLGLFIFSLIMLIRKKNTEHKTVNV